MPPDIFKVSRYCGRKKSARYRENHLKLSFLIFMKNIPTWELCKKGKRVLDGDLSHATTRKRLSITFATHINNAKITGKLLYRDP